MSQQRSPSYYLDHFTNELSIEPCRRSLRSIYKTENEYEITPLPVEVQEINHETVSDEINECGNKRKRKVQTGITNEKVSKVCMDCGKVLASAASLYVHLKSHSSNKPYICNDCGANFTRKYYLEVHQRTHTGERPFSCEICKKSFSQKSSLNTHKRKHTGEKPYQCSMCDKAFSAQSYLASHQWLHYQKNDGVFMCSECDQNFRSRNNFVQHVRTHLGNLVFKCELCSRSFSKEAHLIRHKNGAHFGTTQKNDEE